MDKKRSLKRRVIQLLSALLYNANITGFASGSIFTGKLKGVCVPGLNCYSCPGAVGACPLGALQSALSGAKSIPYYILGVLLLFGVLLGRVICGFLCPFGFLQELLFKIPSPKLKKSKATRALSYMKYVILAVFAVLIPMFAAYPAFCKYICPDGTLLGGIPLVIANEQLRSVLGFLFSWKVFLLAVILAGCVFVFRGFCSFICPLGAIYSFFAKISLIGISLDESKCVNCNKCVHKCGMDIKKVGDRECIQCGECISCCPTGAIQKKRIISKRKESDK